MAKYEIKYSCGHTDVIHLYGKTSERENYLEWAKDNKLCPDCYQECLQKQRDEQNAAAAKANTEAGLPSLIGTEKAVAWAETIRAEKVEELLSRPILEATTPEQQALCSALISLQKRIQSITSASWWIDQRDNSFNLMLLAQRLIGGEKNPLLIVSKIDAAFREQKTYTTPANPQAQTAEANAKAEATVRPENPKTETVAEIHVLEKTVEVVFPEKMEDFRELVRFKLGYEWDKLKSRWHRTINKFNGTPQDRAAELGHKLLAAGFCIRIFDEELRSRAIHGGYEPECHRWIAKRTFGQYSGWFSIIWPREEDFYAAAKKLRGSRYDKPNVVIPPEQFEQVLDFAEMYGFGLSDSAKEVADKSQKLRDAALTAKIEEKEETALPPQPGKKPRKLAVPENVEVADEFKEGA